jgi:site-specific recombinase XerD
MTALSRSLQEYLVLRRALGTKLKGPELHLRRFVEFADSAGSEVITTDLALRWSTAPGRASAVTRARRLGDVRRFATWLSAVDPRTEIPPKDLMPHRYRRKPPYIYSDQEIASILHEAARLASPLGLRAFTYTTLFGLLAVTGLRVSEALGLDRDDVDLEGGVLAVRHAKFGKSRFVPLHDSTCVALRRYSKRRNCILPRRTTSAFFVTERGTMVTLSSADHTFAVVSRAVGLRPPTEAYGCGRRPRLHDMRHRLAVRTLVRWYQEGKDVDRELPKLTTFLGHSHIAHTYWYFEAVPELLQLASERATRRREGPL